MLRWKRNRAGKYSALHRCKSKYYRRQLAFAFMYAIVERNEANPRIWEARVQQDDGPLADPSPSLGSFRTRRDAEIACMQRLAEYDNLGFYDELGY